MAQQKQSNKKPADHLAPKKAKAKQPAIMEASSGGSTTVEEETADPFMVYFRGEGYPLPSLATITFAEMEVLSDLDLSAGLHEVRRIFEAIAPEFAANVLGNLGPKALAKVVLDWQTAAGVSLPNS